MRIAGAGTLSSGLVAALLLLTSVAPATAHHSFAAFDTDASRTITGIVRQVDWTNPHIWIWVDVPNAQGAVDTYGFEGMSPNYLARRNWTRTTLKPGDRITIEYNPLRDGKNGGMFRTGKLDSGKVLTMAGGPTDK